jgi:hypothetical protein
VTKVKKTLRVLLAMKIYRSLDLALDLDLEYTTYHGPDLKNTPYYLHPLWKATYHFVTV